MHFPFLFTEETINLFLSWMYLSSLFYLHVNQRKNTQYSIEKYFLKYFDQQLYKNMSHFLDKLNCITWFIMEAPISARIKIYKNDEHPWLIVRTNSVRPITWLKSSATIKCLLPSVTKHSGFVRSIWSFDKFVSVQICVPVA